ncbi:DUF2125 domain-containing protein [Acidocella sp.]|uniref:DUF2125 domain-containing protein n=1 Tax=Acidocella sp. TaxID=50710 RepID=UPI002631CC50|nr:DUF2125 domain-containing protein [Acidocella sp.]
MRGVIKFLVGLAVLAAIAWAGLWVYAQHRLAGMLSAYATAVTSPDGTSQLTYDSLSTGTSPLSATATLHDVRLSLQPAGLDSPVVARLATVTARIDATQPLTMYIDLPPRLDITADGNDVVLTFGSAALSATLDPQQLFTPAANAILGQSFAFTNLNLLGSSGSIQLAHMDNLSGTEHFALQASAAQTALTTHTQLDGLVLPPWLTQLAQLPFGGKLAHLSLDLTLSGPVDWRALAQQLRANQNEAAQEQLLLTTLHGWALAGGSGSLHTNIVLGPTTLDASGTVKFDDSAQPSGQASLTANHLDALAAQLTQSFPDTQDDIKQAEAQLSPYLTTTSQDGQLLTLHATYGKTGVILNGQNIADMPPLDWNALLNPPADDNGGLAIPAPDAGSGAASP